MARQPEYLTVRQIQLENNLGGEYLGFNLLEYQLKERFLKKKVRKKSTSVSNDLILAKSGFVKLQKNIAPQIVWQLFLNGSHNFYNHMSGREMINMLGCNCF